MFKPILVLTLLGATALGGCGAASEPDADPEVAGGTGGGGSGSGAGTGGSAAGTGGSAAGTGGTAGAAPRDPPEANRYPDCLAEDQEEPCHPRGFPFVNHAFAHSYCEDCSAPGGTLSFTQPDPGTVCLSGTLDTEEEDAGGIALVFPALSSENLTFDHQTVVERFNAESLGITQVRFTVDPPPPGGIFLWATTLHSDECNGGDCITAWFTLESFITDIDDSGTITVPFTDFIDESGKEFDARSLGQLGIDVGPGAVDYCIRDLQFLDANGVVVEDDTPDR